MDDPTINPGYVNANYLAKVSELSRHIKLRSYELMNLSTGHQVIDVGCGPATDTLPMAKLTGPTGLVIGIDYDTAMVQEADRLAGQAGLQECVLHICTQVPPIPYPDGTFHSARSERVFQHLTDPQSVLNEMRRVTRPGGWVVVVDTDWSSSSVDIEEEDLVDIEWRLRRARVEMMNNGLSGRKLYRQFRQAGLCDLSVEFYPIPIHNYAVGRLVGVWEKVEQFATMRGIVTEDEIKRLRAILERADQADTLFAYGIILLVAGRVP